MAKKNANNCVVLRVSEKTREKLIKFYEDKKRDKVIPYVVFQAQDGDTVVTLYESGKVMFQGVSADIDANMWADIDGVSRIDKVKISKEEPDDDIELLFENVDDVPTTGPVVNVDKDSVVVKENVVSDDEFFDDFFDDDNE